MLNNTEEIDNNKNSMNRRLDYVYPHNKKGYVVIFFVICILLISMWGVYYQYRSDLVVSVSETELKISGLYGTDIMYDDIQEVTLQNRLPHIKLRSNGFAVGNVRLGNFITKDDVHVILFAHSDSCFIRIVTKSDNIYYLSAKKPDETIKIFRIIKKITEGQTDNPPRIRWVWDRLLQKRSLFCCVFEKHYVSLQLGCPI